MSIEQEIKELAERHLPSATAGVLSEYLNQAEEAQIELGELQQLLEEEKEHAASLEQQITELHKTVSEYEAKERLWGDFNAREDALTKRESSREAEIASLERQAAEDKCNMMHELVSKVFGHPSVMVTNNRQIFNPAASSTQHTTDTEMKTTTKT